MGTYGYAAPEYLETRVLGTYGYAAPEYIATGILVYKDIFVQIQKQCTLEYFCTIIYILCNLSPQMFFVS